MSQNQIPTQAEKSESEHRLEEAKLGLERSRQEVLFWEDRVRQLSGSVEEGRPIEARLQDAIRAAKWTEKGESFAWAFRTNEDGSERREVLPLVEAIETDPKRRIVIDEYEYRLSDNRKFLHRRKLGA